MSGQEPAGILSGIFERSLSLDNKKNSADRAMSVWEGMARSLEEIAANTRQGLSKKATGTHGGQAQATGNSAKDRAPSPLKETALPGRRKKTTSTHSILSASNSEGRQAEPKPTSERTPVIVQASDSPTRRLPQEGLLSGSHSEGKPTESGGSAGKTKSQESLERAKSESANKAQAQTIADTLKQNLGKWDGTVANGDGDAEEAAGLAVGGPVYTAIKEVTGVLESKDEDDNSLFGVLKKSIADKTGITAVKEKAESAKEGLKDRIRGWAGKQDAAQVEEEKAKRDKEGRFTRLAPNTAEKEQTELATQSFDLAQRESKESKKRHQELVRAVRSIDGGGGLLDNALDSWTGRGGRGRNGKDGKPGKAGRFGRGGDTGRTKGKPAAPKGRLARMGSRLGGLGSKALAAGAGILGVGSLFGGAVAAPAGVAATSAVAASTVARSAAPATTVRAVGATGRGTGLLGRAGTMVGKAGSLAGKGLAGAARAIPVFGQLLAAGMAIKDGVQGWNDTEMHQSAFGLAEGEEASTGQKASAAAANALDMGGLLTGLAGLAGFEIDTADIAGGIYTAGTVVTDTVVKAWDAVGGNISSASAAAGSAIAQAWDTASTGISEAASGAWDAITGAASSAWDKASTAVAETATEAWDSVTEGTAKAWDSASSAASSAIAITGEAVSNAWDSASATASGALTAAGDAVSSAWDSTSSTVGGAATNAWDSVSSGASAAWSGVTGFFSGDKPEERAPEKSEATTITQAVAAVPATTLLGEKLPSAAQTKPGDKEEKRDEDELGVDAVIVPDEETVGLFGTLTEAVSGLSQTIKDEIKRKELENGGMFSAVGGLVSGVSTWVKDRLSNVGGGGRGSGTVAQSATGGTSKRYTYDPDAKIGEAIAKYESGTGGSSTIGYDRKGGTSYGKYQLASNAGSMEGFLKMMEGKGGEHAAIAARLRAAGPANTGSRNGEMPEQWKKEAAANGELLQAAELEYMLKANYGPAMQELGDELRGKVEGSKALQEAMFSTAVQHGPGRTSGIWNEVYKEGMSEEDLIRAVYTERATRFGSSTPQIQDSARRRMASEQELILSMRRGESTAQATAAAIQNSPQDQAVQAASSSLIQGLTQDAMNRGVGYDFNSTNSQSGATNCSGWITELNTLLMEAINASAKREVFGPEAKRALSKGGTAAGIIQSVSEATGGLLSGDALAPENVTEGMMIGLDASASAGADRFKGIDHIVQTFRDPKTGQMMVSESSSGDIEGKGRNGVMETPYATWHEHQTKKGRAMYGADPTKLADASVLAETAVAANQPAAQTIAGTAPAQTAQAPAAEAQQVAAAAAVQPQGIVPATVAAPIAAAVPNPRPQNVESVGDIAPPDNTGSNTMQTAGIEKLLQGILAVLTQQGKNSAQAGGEGPPHINMDFDDQTALGLAHDRA